MTIVIKNEKNILANMAHWLPVEITDIIIKKAFPYYKSNSRWRFEDWTDLYYRNVWNVMHYFLTHKKYANVGLELGICGVQSGSIIYNWRETICGKSFNGMGGFLLKGIDKKFPKLQLDFESGDRGQDLSKYHFWDYWPYGGDMAKNPNDYDYEDRETYRSQRADMDYFMKVCRSDPTIYKKMKDLVIPVQYNPVGTRADGKYLDIVYIKL
tara:strand:+ start:55 stop:687 length:633 start_codon:yes stop_codon:yes gene_type:complete